jgi:hypothetical protein
MALYLLVTEHPMERTQTQSLTRLATLYPDHKAVADNAWIIQTSQTSKEISETLFPRIDKTHVRSHVIVLINGYYGWHNPQLWEWMASKRGE